MPVLEVDDSLVASIGEFTARSRVVLVECDYGEVDEVALVRQLRRLWPGARVVVLPPESEPRPKAKPVAKPGPPALTTREREVLHCVTVGYDNREIAQALGIAVRTVNRHLDAIRDKLGTRRRSELMRVGREWSVK
jgi:DNA-binding NarL/FixJ family response regulator